MYVLIVMTFISGSWTVSMQEFSEEGTCKSAGFSIEAAFKSSPIDPRNLKLFCLHK